MRQKIEDIRKRATRRGAMKPPTTSPFWNEWAANNPQPEAVALGKLDFGKSMLKSIKGIVTGARPIVK